MILTACTALVAGGVKYVSMVSPLFLVPVLLTVLCMWIGFFTIGVRSGFSTGPLGEQYIADGWDITRVWSSDFSEAGGCSETGFFVLLALFFPSVTGIMAGSNRSGDLRNAQQSIPRGTIGAQVLTTVLYLSTTIFYGCIGTREGLKEDYLLSATVAWPTDIIVRIGIVLSTLGAGLQSLTGAPRLLQAIANDNLVPFLRPFQGTGEPRRPLMLTYFICMGCIIPGQIDIVAPIITMFFLCCYTAVNGAVLVQDVLKEPNWRPRFKYYHMGTAFSGFTLCLFIMFATQWYVALIAISVVACLYKYIEYQKVAAHWGDGMRGMRFQRARQALLELEKIDAMHTKNWRPQVLLYAKVDSDGNLKQPRLLPFCGQLKGARGVTIISTAIEGRLEDSAATQMRVEKRIRKLRDEEGVRGFTQVVMTEDVETALDSLLQTAGLGGLGPNTVVTLWPDSWRTNITGAQRMKQILLSAQVFNNASILLKGIEAWPLSNEHLHSSIDIWWVVHDGGLLLLLAIILRKHHTWHRCHLNVYCVCTKGDDAKQLERIIAKFLYDMRISATLKVKQLAEVESLDSLLPVRGAQWSEFKVKEEIIKNPLGLLAGSGPATLEHPKDKMIRELKEENDRLKRMLGMCSAGSVSAQDEPGKEVGSATERVAVSATEEVAPQAVSASGVSAAVEDKPVLGSTEMEMTEEGVVSAELHPDLAMRTGVVFNQLMLEESNQAALIMTNLPLPDIETSVEDYMAHLEALVKGLMPPVMLVAGKKAGDVVTMYS